MRLGRCANKYRCACESLLTTAWRPTCRVQASRQGPRSRGTERTGSAVQRLAGGSRLATRRRSRRSSASRARALRSTRPQGGGDVPSRAVHVDHNGYVVGHAKATAARRLDNANRWAALPANHAAGRFGNASIRSSAAAPSAALTSTIHS
jgi:hypothetical protein